MKFFDFYMRYVLWFYIKIKCRTFSFRSMLKLAVDISPFIQMSNITDVIQKYTLMILYLNFISIILFNLHCIYISLNKTKSPTRCARFKANIILNLIFFLSIPWITFDSVYFMHFDRYFPVMMKFNRTAVIKPLQLFSAISPNRIGEIVHMGKGDCYL